MRLLPLLMALCVAGCAQQVVVYPDAAESMSDGGASDGGVVDSGPGSDSGPDSGVIADLGVADSGAPDTGAPVDAGPPDSGVLACTVDPFAQCTDTYETARTNDSWTDATRYSGSCGCIQGDDLTTLEGTQLGRVCQTEVGDYHSLTIVPCDTRTLTLQVRLHMLTDCDPSKYELGLLHGGGVRNCGDLMDGEPIVCSEDGLDRIIQLRIPPDDTVQSWYFAVLSDEPDVQFDYDLQVSVR